MSGLIMKVIKKQGEAWKKNEILKGPFDIQKGLKLFLYRKKSISRLIWYRLESGFKNAHCVTNFWKSNPKDLEKWIKSR